MNKNGLIQHNTIQNLLVTGAKKKWKAVANHKQAFLARKRQVKSSGYEWRAIKENLALYQHVILN